MNIFYLSADPKTAAQYHLNKHVVKMIIESAQLLCTAHRLLDGKEIIRQEITKTGKTRNVRRYIFSDPNKEKLLYKASHIHHPCSVWARANINNYMWLYELFVALCDEYTFRYGKIHKSYTLLRDVLSSPPYNISKDPFTQPAQAMPAEYKHEDPVQAYRQYYIGAKRTFARWTKRTRPEWFNWLDVSGDSHANV
jgi:hypothetical protein